MAKGDSDVRTQTDLLWNIGSQKRQILVDSVEMRSVQCSLQMALGQSMVLHGHRGCNIIKYH